MRFLLTDLMRFRYLKDHEAVWPEMQTALVECGWHNYSLFYREDGLAVGYFESDGDFAQACDRMDGTEVNARWQTEMSKYTPKNLSPIDAAGSLTHYFFLGDDKVDEPASPPPTPPFDKAWTPQAQTGAGSGLTKAGLKRVCFTLQFETEVLPQYLKDHENVWPEMQEALVACGWLDYSLFYREDGFAVGFFLTDSESSFKECCDKMGKMPGLDCPVYSDPEHGDKCGDCTACYEKPIKNINYLQH